MVAVIEQYGKVKACVTCLKADIDKETEKRAAELVAEKKMEGGYYDVYTYRYERDALAATPESSWLQP